MDTLTESVTIAALIYTQELEVYTYAGVEFTMDAGGRPHAMTFMKSYRETDGSEFLIAPLIVFGIVMIGAIALAVDWAIDRLLSIVVRFLDVVVLGLIALFVVVMQIWWSQLPYMRNSFLELNKQFITTSNMTHVGRKHGVDAAALDAFLAASGDLVDIDAWQTGFRVGSYFAFQFLAGLAVIYLKVHPSTRILVDACTRSFIEILTLGCIFSAQFFPGVEQTVH
jgi:hypothetical protein